MVIFLCFIQSPVYLPTSMTNDNTNCTTGSMTTNNEDVDSVSHQNENQRSELKFLDELPDVIWMCCIVPFFDRYDWNTMMSVSRSMHTKLWFQSSSTTSPTAADITIGGRTWQSSLSRHMLHISMIIIGFQEELADGLHLIDFEQLKIENQTYNEKIEERNEELLKLRKKITNTVQVLTHLKEKLQFVQGENSLLKNKLKDVEGAVAQVSIEEFGFHA